MERDRSATAARTTEGSPVARDPVGGGPVLLGVVRFIIELLRGLLGMTLLLAAVFGTGAVIVMSLLGNPMQQIPVPDVVGMTEAEAERVLSEADLRMRVGGREYDAETPEGRIVRTEPHAGKQVKSGRNVQIYLSQGRRTVTMPEVTGMTVFAAERRLQEEGLFVEEIRRRTSQTERDIVLEQQPEAGKETGRRDGAVLVVSGGERFGMIEVPDGAPWVYKRLQVVIPRGAPLQRVEVLMREDAGQERVLYDRVHRPGDRVRLNVVGRKGWRLWVNMAEEQVFAQDI